ncbi:hypothetical protein [Ornithinimicrobium cerasi]|uniref:DNA-directed RNA polymerase subunit beta n=1 Tax=Ornithinimicrobium cerasi TaxID=2248773 RepID=A0A285VSH8_9MICO|nr:hypothetical protein [Ornithinimicrobium cerasi]SOC57005.1 hypothetical protein SAMN05421879_11049 [Ornithinimicrobium cerasi]
MSGMRERRPFHRPTLRPSEVLEDVAGGIDPLEAVEAAHRTAELVVGRGRDTDDPRLTARLVALVQEVGLSTVAEMWADRPARTLPGALWRLYLLHEWVQRQPEETARLFAAGAGHAEVYRAIAGVAEPPDTEGLRRLTEQILTGVFTGDLAIALERAAAFCQVMAVGLAEPGVEHVPVEQVRRGARMRDTADDLSACARLWRLGDLH